MTSVSADHIILTPTQPAGSERSQRKSNPVPPHQESRALPTELPRPQHSTCEMQEEPMGRDKTVYLLTTYVCSFACLSWNWIIIILYSGISNRTAKSEVEARNPTEQAVVIIDSS